MIRKLLRSDPIEYLQKMITALWGKTGLGNCTQVDRWRTDNGSAHVEYHGDQYDIVVTERGRETQRMSSFSRLAAARWFVFGMAVNHSVSDEARDRRASPDAPPMANGRADPGYSRWNWMAPKIAVMRQISPDFGEWAVQHYDEILRKYPLSEREIRNARYPVPTGKS